jgi:hypothetical protein
MMRVDLGALLEVLDLHTCTVTDYAAVQQSSEDVVVVWSPTGATLKAQKPSFTTCYHSRAL